MMLSLVIPGPLDRRSGGYSYDLDLVDHLTAEGHVVELWCLPLEAGAARRELKRRLGGPLPQVVIFDALVHGPVVGALRRLRPKAPSLWVALVHHLAWLDEAPPRTAAPGKKARERRFLNLMDAFLLNSDDTRRTVAELRGQGAEFRPSLVCRPLFPPDAPTNPLPGTGGRLLFLGNLLPRKNLHGLLGGLARLHARRPDLKWTLTVAGGDQWAPAYARRCRQIARRAGISDRLAWEGWVSPGRRAELLAGADLLALPSFHEGWGMAHAEALSQGLPSLAVPQGAAPELLGDGALWSSATPESLADALERYLTDPILRDDLGRRSRHRALVWRGEATGFARLVPFLTTLIEPPSPPPEFDFGRYLEAKATVDDRSLHPRVWAEAWGGGPVGSVVELGGGTGTMARRLRAAGRVGPDTAYELVDQDAASLALARRMTAPLFDEGKFVTRQTELLTYWQGFPPVPRRPGPDLVIAHALLDLFDPRSAAPALARMGARRYWLTHLFDGMTTWEPVIDPVLDDQLVNAYHRSMAERAPGEAHGGPRSARDWLKELPRAGMCILDVAASDWLVRPHQGAYPDREAVFLQALLHFFRTALAGRDDVDQKGLSWWLAARGHQVDRGEVTFSAHQFDVAAELRPADMR